MPRIAILSLLVLFIGACEQRAAPPQQVVAQASVLPADFALDTVVALMKQGVTDGQSLETRINDPASGINNLDFDRDGRVDYAMVRETPTATGTRMAILDHPSGGGADTEIASITFDREPAGVAVRAGYAPFVDPAGAYLYRDTFGADLAFAQWLFMTRSPFLSPVPISGYAYRSRVAPTVVESTRSTFRTETRVSPVRNASPTPPAARTAERAEVRAGVAPPKSDGTLRGTAAGLSDFRVNDRPKPAAVGVTSPAPARTTSPPPSLPRVSTPARAPSPAPRAPAPSPPKPAPASKSSVATGRTR